MICFTLFLYTANLHLLSSLKIVNVLVFCEMIILNFFVFASNLAAFAGYLHLLI